MCHRAASVSCVRFKGHFDPRDVKEAVKVERIPPAVLSSLFARVRREFNHIFAATNRFVEPVMQGRSQYSFKIAGGAQGPRPGHREGDQQYCPVLFSASNTMKKGASYTLARGSVRMSCTTYTYV